MFPAVPPMTLFRERGQICAFAVSSYETYNFIRWVHKYLCMLTLNKDVLRRLWRKGSASLQIARRWDGEGLWRYQKQRQWLWCTCWRRQWRLRQGLYLYYKIRMKSYTFSERELITGVNNASSRREDVRRSAVTNGLVNAPELTSRRGGS